MKTALPFLVLLASALAATAQPSFTRSQCVEYALQNNVVVKNSLLDTRIADNKKREIRARGLPQIDGNSQAIHNFNVQKIVLENGVIPLFSVPSLPAGHILAFQLQLNNVWTSQLNATQVIFDKALFTGLADADIAKSLSLMNTEQAEIKVAALVNKAYYGVLVAQKQFDFLDHNIRRVDSLYRETSARFKNGLVRKIAVDRIEVRLNNLKEEREKTAKIIDLDKAMLRFQMNLPEEEPLELADSLEEGSLADAIEKNAFDYTQRVEYGIMKTQQHLYQTETQLLKDGYYPRLNAFATSGYNPAATHASDIFQGSRYFNFTYVGLNLNVPLFHGFEKRIKVQSRRLEDLKMTNSIQNLKQSISLQVQQATIDLFNNLESLKIQKRNLDLAQENVRETQIENEKGVATSLEVINAETDLKEAQNNYYSTLYQALLAKTDLEIANGTLLKK
jgi:outer membrane protein